MKCWYLAGFAMTGLLFSCLVHTGCTGETGQNETVVDGAQFIGQEAKLAKQLYGNRSVEVAAKQATPSSETPLDSGSTLHGSDPEAALHALNELMVSYSAMKRGREKADLAEEILKLPVKSEVLPALLDTVIAGTDNETVALAQQMLAAMPDSHTMLESLQEQYRLSQTVDERIALAEVCRYLEDEQAVPALVQIMRNASSFSDPLAEAVVDALGYIGNEPAKSALQQELETRGLKSDQMKLNRSLVSALDNQF